MSREGYSNSDLCVCLMSICVTRASLLINIPIYLGFFASFRARSHFGYPKTDKKLTEPMQWDHRHPHYISAHDTPRIFFTQSLRKGFSETNFCVHTITRTWTLVIDVRLKLMCNQTDRISHLGKGFVIGKPKSRNTDLLPSFIIGDNNIIPFGDMFV